ncbi:MAG TPA: carbohydrate ABC transporter permease [Acetobacteraceae bacterium]|jgi:multiple sugar transport system permease protein|nr:carbohydrate ABC transporter permease [Acetobacteraceae bacterium]
MSAPSASIAGLGLDLRAIARRERAVKRRIGVMRAAVSIFAVLVWLLPFYLLFATSFKGAIEYGTSGLLTPPRTLSAVIGNVVEAWRAADMGPAMFNSLIYGMFGATGAVFIAALAAYGLSRLPCVGRQVWFMLIFAGTLFPFQMFLIPLFFGYQRLGLLNSRPGMLLLYTAICIPFPTLVLKNYFSQIPLEMDEAARIEGCSEWRVFRSILLPNARPALFALFLLQFTWIWNDLLFSSVLANRDEVRSVMVSLQVFQGAYTNDGPPVILAGALIASLPTIALFLLLRRSFLAGLQLSAVR